MPKQADDVTQVITDLRKTVRNIKSAVESVKASGISDDAIYTLIRRACKPAPSIKMIRIVCEGIRSLEEYVFPNKQ